MISLPIIILSGAVAAALGGAELSKNGGTNEEDSIVIGNYTYFAMYEVGNHTEAHANCKKIDSLAELAIIDGPDTYYKLVRISNVPSILGTYWINGKSDYMTFPNLLTDCQDSVDAWDLPISSPDQQCLAIVKAQQNSRVRSLTCSTQLPAVCSIPTSKVCNNPIINS